MLGIERLLVSCPVFSLSPIIPPLNIFTLVIMLIKFVFMEIETPPLYDSFRLYISVVGIIIYIFAYLRVKTAKQNLIFPDNLRVYTAIVCFLYAFDIYL